MNEHLLQRAVMLKQQSEEAENQFDFVNRQINELEQFSKGLKELEKEKEQEILAPLGRGIYTKAKKNINEKLFVEVGAGVVVRKSPEETREIIEGQLKKFDEARIQLITQLEVFRHEFGNLLKEVERIKKNNVVRKNI